MNRSFSMNNLVETALQGMPQGRRATTTEPIAEVPVRPPRARSLVRTLLQGDALKADVRRFFRVRKSGIPAEWDADAVIAVEQILSRDPGYRPGGYLGLLRFSCDLREGEANQVTWSEARLWSLVRRRLSSSSGLMLLRSVANAHEILQSLIDDADASRRRGFCDLLRVLGARTEQPYLEHPRTIDRPVWEFGLVLSLRADQYNSEFRGTGSRPVRCLDLLLGATSVYLRERGQEPGLAELRSGVLQTGAPLGPALESWVRTFAGTQGQSLLPGALQRDDPRDWVWQTGQNLLDPAASVDRMGQIASCERALLERARTQENWKEDVAFAVHGELRRELERVLPESRRLVLNTVDDNPSSSTGLLKVTDSSWIAKNTTPSSAGFDDTQTIQAAIAAFDFHPSETVDGLPTVGFGIPDLERQARLVSEGWRTGWTPLGRGWAEHYRALLGDSRVREFMRFEPSWIASLRDLLTESDPWLMAGWEDLVRWMYPVPGRAEPLEFRQQNRPGVPANRTGWDWTVLRLHALALAEVVSAAREPGLAPSCLVVVRRWQTLAHALDLDPTQPEWWAWISHEVESRTDAESGRRFPPVVDADEAWRVQNVAPWIALPALTSAEVLGEWVKDPLVALRSDAHPVHERWASRLSMLTQLQEEAKEESMAELLRRV